MSDQKRYTAQEMRDAAQYLVDNLWAKDSTIVAMFRQAADAEEELAKAKRPDACPANPTNKMCYLPGEYCCDTVRYLQKENAKLRARLEAVEKMLEEKERATSCSDCGRYNGYPCVDHGECGLFKRHEEFTAILRATRGELENK